MNLTPGTRLGPYEIVTRLGAGGMGEVWRATDTKLGRDVAIKVLPEAFASDAQRMTRFEREAQVLASLNHPNIATMHGLEESGATRALVMELVGGTTLADRIAQGPIPIEEALPIARQIGEALEYAHEHGIIHRDLKPANVKITPEGAVKLLDFGLAKAVEGEKTLADSAHSPTLSLNATQAGVILGSAGYMSPEQARGRTVDRRADIWAFGVVLFEMLTARAAFDGETVTDVLAAVVTREPDWSALPPGSPIHTLRRCLEKDPRRRLRDIGDAFFEGEPLPATTARVSLWRQPLVWGLLGIAVLSSALALFLWTRSASTTGRVLRLVIPLPSDQEVTDYPAISPDGRTVAYAARQGTGEPQLYLRDLDSFEARAVSGSNGARQPFFSPDGRWVAFFARGLLLKASVGGGAPTRIADAAAPNGGCWNADDTITFTSGFKSELLRVSATGGRIESLTRRDEGDAGFGHLFPQALAGGRGVLSTIWGKGTGVLSLETRRWEIVLPGWASAVFGSSDYLFVSDETGELKLASFDPTARRQTSAHTSVLTDVYYSDTARRPWIAVSESGTAVYAHGSPAKRSLVLRDLEGRVTPVSKEQARYSQSVVSPDGSRAAVKQGVDLWIHDLRFGTRSRLTFMENVNGEASSPVWSWDGTRIVFSSDARGRFAVYSQPADGSRPAEPLLERPHDLFPTSIAPDGAVLINEAQPSTGEDLWVLLPDGKASPIRATPFNEDSGEFSPDGRRLAYASDETGRYEIYVQNYPGGERRIPVSSGGGVTPKWSPDGRELYYLTGDAMVAAAMKSDGTFAPPRRLFDRADYYQSWNHGVSVAPDGKRFLMIRRDPGSVPRRLHVIVNWFEELRRAAPQSRD